VYLLSVSMRGLFRHLAEVPLVRKLPESSCDGAHRGISEDCPSQTSKHSDKHLQKMTRSTRLVLDFNSSGRPPPPVDLGSPAQICASLNEFLLEARFLKAVTRTRAGNWILHNDRIRCDSHTLMQYQPDITKGLHRLGGGAGRRCVRF
jgi:hypothetical protein